MKNLQIEFEDLSDIVEEDLHDKLLLLPLTVNASEIIINEKKDAFDELYDNFNELRDLLDDFENEEENLTESSIEGALNITRESLERLKKAQKTMEDTKELLKEISVTCDNLKSIPVENTNTTHTNDQLNVSSTILNELLTNYTHFNVKMCQVVNVTCQVQNCSDISCLFEVEKDLKNKRELLENALKEMKMKEKKFDGVIENVSREMGEHKKAKNKMEDAIAEVKAENYHLNNLIMINETLTNKKKIKNISDTTMEIDFPYDDELLLELIDKIDDALENITDVHDLIEDAVSKVNSASKLLQDAINVR